MYGVAFLLALNERNVVYNMHVMNVEPKLEGYDNDRKWNCKIKRSASVQIFPLLYSN